MEDLIFAPQEGKVQRISVGTTGDRTQLEPFLLGPGWIRVKANGASVDIVFGGVDVNVPTFGNVGTSTDAWPLAAGEWMDFYLVTETHVAWEAGGTGDLALMPAGRKHRP